MKAVFLPEIFRLTNKMAADSMKKSVFSTVSVLSTVVTQSVHTIKRAVANCHFKSYLIPLAVKFYLFFKESCSLRLMKIS